MPSTPKTTDGLAMNGHIMTYPVKGQRADGSPITDQIGAYHSDRCPCLRNNDR